jgi:hypothetical protein
MRQLRHHLALRLGFKTFMTRQGFLLTLIAAASLLVPVTGRAGERRLLSVQAKDLNERPFAFPADATGTPAIGVFVYRGKDQAEATRILTMVERFRPANPGITAREFPVISVPTLARGIINRGMRSGIPSVQTRSNVITLYVPDLYVWQRATGFTDPRAVYVAIMTGGVLRGSILSTQLRTDADLQRFLDAPRPL